MQGKDEVRGSLFSYVDLERRVRADHPLRLIRGIVNAFGAVRGGLDRHFGSDGIHFTCEGSDEMDHACGDGDVDLEEDGTLR